MNEINFIPNEKLQEIFKDDKGVPNQYIEFLGDQEIDGLLYNVYADICSGKKYASRKTRTVHMGYSTSEPDRIERFVGIVEKEGACEAFWAVVGRERHEALANQLASLLPQYDWEIDGNYRCIAKKY